ncbi:hypothetical protein OX283_011580 [Flavobacterium sp. SUN052]|uniref:hypothetical protein n=1 Tax=Flavobacterium sp. SUN052 TaxID=3002441 RepID=UPI00237E4CCD|nr:hypothetical protein [Flavobacterium sp. SUN052]MEC4005298.1 hypothetical protein [Flavobacterium sp. SUN052]
MTLVTKKDLYYSDYFWTELLHNNPKISGKLDTTRFNRTEGFEVLYLINKMIELWDFEKIESARKIERIIREKLPDTINSQADIVVWIQINWKTIDIKINA